MLLVCSALCLALRKMETLQIAVKKTLNEEEEEKMPQPPQIKFLSYFSNELPWPRGGSDRNPQQPAKEKKSSCQDRFCNYFSEQFDAESGVS